jgi:hypothetical protein
LDENSIAKNKIGELSGKNEALSLSSFSRTTMQSGPLANSTVTIPIVEYGRKLIEEGNYGYRTFRHTSAG